MLALMVDKLADRKERVNAAMSGKHTPNYNQDTVVSEDVLFGQLGGKLKVVKPSQ